MKNIIIITLSLMLTGCPGGPRAPHPRSVFINGENLCFSLNKHDVLNYYTITSTETGDIKTIKSSGDKKLNLSYPENCITIKWKYGYSYVINYGLNDKKYTHGFFIDNNGQLTNTGGL